ncbi:hypothetical protein ACQP1V_14055 [Microtetraspora malaysiensis]|uniref:hypothetical protein n=1 Tax=Microtetraspora malaysiensis TaxID=161358 RepID=UPI003D8C91E7
MITSAILVIIKIARITVLARPKDSYFAFGENLGRPQLSMSATVTLTATVTLDDEG